MQFILGAIGFILIAGILAFRKWSDIPIRYDSTFHCEVCGSYTPHTCTAYKDIEYRTCKRCGTHTTWEPQGKTLEQTGSERPDVTKEGFDFKRQNPRKYRKRRKSDEEDDE